MGYAYGRALCRATRRDLPGKRCEAVFNLQCPDGPAELRENYGFSLKELTRIETFLAANLAITCREWERLHGDPLRDQAGQCEGDPHA